MRLFNRSNDKQQLARVAESSENNAKQIEQLRREVAAMHECMHNNLVHEQEPDYVHIAVNAMTGIVIIATIIMLWKAWKATNQ